MKKEINEPKIKGMDRNNIIVAEYIGCRTIPYNPVSITFWFSCTSIVLERKAFSLITSAYIRYDKRNIATAIQMTQSGSECHEKRKFKAATTKAAINMIPDNATTHFCSPSFSLASSLFFSKSGDLNNITIPKIIIGTNKTAIKSHAFQ